MLRKDGSEQKVDEMERFLPPGIVFVVFPALLSLLGVFVMAQLPWLLGQYNYLMGASSPIDQYALVLLGPDLTRIIVLISGIIGMVAGLYLSHFVTAKLDVVRKEGETGISNGMYSALMLWWTFLVLPVQTISLLEIFYGIPTSKFLSDLGWFMAAGCFLAYSIPVLLKYIRLVLHASSIDSQIVLIGLQSRSGFRKRFQNLTLRVIHDGPDP